MSDAAGRRAARRVHGLINAAAGTAAPDTDDLRQALAAAFAAHDIDATIELLPPDKLQAAATRAAAAAKAGEVDVVVVGGGDGTISTVAGILADTGVPLGVLPLGTLNHFTKDLGIPQALADAVAVIAHGHTRRVDLADVNGTVFINNSSIGLYPLMVLDRDRRQAAHGLSKWTAMALATLRALRHFPRRRLAIRAEGIVEPCRTPCLFVGNNPYTLSLPAIGERTRLDGGVLCLYVAKARGRLGLLWLAMRVSLGWLRQERDLRILTTRAVEIRSRASRLLVAVDGEVSVMRPPLRYRIRPGALVVFAPAASG